MVVVTGAAVAALQSWSGKPLSKLLAAATGSEYAVGYVLHAVAAVVAIAYLVHLARSAIGPREDRV